MMKQETMKQEIMKQEKMNFAQFSRTVLWLGLIVCFGLTAARAQVIPTVCFESKPETLTRTLSRNSCAGRADSQCNGFGNTVGIGQAVPRGNYMMIFVGAADGSTRETLYGFSDPNILSEMRLTTTNFPPQTYLYNHAAGETVLLVTEGDAVFGYHNSGTTAVTFPRGVGSGNYFTNGLLVYPQQPSNFLPGVHSDVLRLKVNSTINPTWLLNGGQVTPNPGAGQSCATITYQGRLSDAGNAANGQFDLQFQAFDTETGGVVQSELITLENVQVTNGIFTVPLFFGSTFANNFKPRFLEIGVRAGTSTGAFTVLTPRQPITSVPFAVNAQFAMNAVDATNVTGKGTIKIPLVTGPPPNTAEGGCGSSVDVGNLKADPINNRLYVCMNSGWRAFVPQ